MGQITFNYDNLHSHTCEVELSGSREMALEGLELFGLVGLFGRVGRVVLGRPRGVARTGVGCRCGGFYGRRMVA